MKQYHDLLQHILNNGVVKEDRTGIGTKSIFGHQMRFNLQDGFPLMTTKKVPFRLVAEELLWFLTGNTNIRPLVQKKVHIWDEWPFQSYLKANNLEQQYPMYSEQWKDKKKEFIERIIHDELFAEQWGDLGPVYGKQWTRWEAPNGEQINQLQNAINMLKSNPHSRRIIISGWNVADIQTLITGKTSAPPLCHTVFQFYVVNNKLSCQLYQRSADVFLGVPFNIASYSLLTLMMAQVCNLEPGEFIHTFGDAHIYMNHQEQVALQLSRETKTLPKLKINPEKKDLFSFTIEDFQLEDYDPHPRIKAPIAV